MRFTWTYTGKTPIKLKSFLKQQHVSRRLLAKVRHEGGQILVDGKEGRTIDKITTGQSVALLLPPEHGRKADLVPSYVPLQIIYEDRDLLVVNKPPYLPSVPSELYPGDSLVNRVWGYYLVRGYSGIIPHIVTRLDRDTSGVALFAKHRYAHALLDVQLQAHQFVKQYLAVVSGQIPSGKAVHVTSPIKRDETSLFKRMTASDGKAAVTDLRCLHSWSDHALLLAQPKTGRTHQIRVHCASLGWPLLGDTMYGGVLSQGMGRQALHCYRLSFRHPLTAQRMTFQAPVAADMRKFVDNI